MNFQELAVLVEEKHPGLEPADQARICLSLINTTDDLESLSDEAHLDQASQEMKMRMQAATDQHAAMTSELEELAQSDPKEFCPDQIWILIRAIKVQSQILQMYLGQPALDV